MNSAELREQLSHLVGDYPHPQAALVPALHLLREQGSPINTEALSVIADVCSVELQQVAEIVSHYSISQNASQPHPSLCFGLICYLNGAREIFDQLTDKSRGACDERLEGAKVSSCLGYCYAAPVVRLDDGSICQVSHSN